MLSMQSVPELEKDRASKLFLEWGNLGKMLLRDVERGNR